jgi:hypothetical protein
VDRGGRERRLGEDGCRAEKELFLKSFKTFIPVLYPNLILTL